MAQLALTIEREIIPRLMLVHRAVEAEAPAAARSAPTLSAATRCMPSPSWRWRRTKAWLRPMSNSCVARGLSVERVYLDLLGPTAQYLGLLWEQDLCDFTDVTVGLGRLQRVMRELSPAFGKSVEYPRQRPARAVAAQPRASSTPSAW